jgi:hypothetical protein
MKELKNRFFKSENEDRMENDQKLESGVVTVTGKNLDRLIFGKHDDYEPALSRKFNFILIVCRIRGKKSRKMCEHAKKFINFLREQYLGNKLDIRIGVMNHELNEHPLIEKKAIENFPSLIFFGKNADQKSEGKIFRSSLTVDKVLIWLNKKLAENGGEKVDLTDEKFQELLLLMAKNKEERKKLERLLKKGKQKLIPDDDADDEEVMY